MKLDLRLSDEIHSALGRLAKKRGMDTAAYAILVLSKHVAEQAELPKRTVDMLHLKETLIDRAVAKARTLDAAGQFDVHFTRTIFRELMKDEDYRRDYERFVGGNAYENGLPQKAINKDLGRSIKIAVGAETVADENGDPKRQTVRNEPIQSYTLLRK